MYRLAHDLPSSGFQVVNKLIQLGNLSGSQKHLRTYAEQLKQQHVLRNKFQWSELFYDILWMPFSYLNS